MSVPALLAPLGDAPTRGGSARSPLRLALQPIRAVATMALVGHEALLRSHPWESPGWSSIVEMEDQWWFPGLTAEILAGAARVAPTDVRADLHVNVSANDLRRGQLVGSVERALERRPDLAGRLVLEVTEHHPVADHPDVHEVLRRLRAMEVRIAVDDFGTGWANFASLRVLQPAVVKIEVDVVRAAPHILGCVVPRVRELTDGVVYVEGEASPGELVTYAAQGVVAVQGHPFGRPRLAGLGMPRVGPPRR